MSSAVETKWLPSSVIPLDNRHRHLSSGPPGLPDTGIFLGGSAGSIVCNNTAGFPPPVSHICREISGGPKAIRLMEIKK